MHRCSSGWSATLTVCTPGFDSQERDRGVSPAPLVGGSLLPNKDRLCLSVLAGPAKTSVCHGRTCDFAQGHLCCTDMQER